MANTNGPVSVLSKHFGAWGMSEARAPGQRTYEDYAARHPYWSGWEALTPAGKDGWAMAEAQQTTPHCPKCAEKQG